ncbi:PBECR2 nuclease fold domain-containing protein [Clostridium sp. 001]|uniref:PBECR3 domain-containing polyvalent protein n=1 Tax=Clostridium sp. 001 TaxID=1970093 RepID=UPI001C2C6A26|nr:PBECR2 nuclease fold domain-containing protein [Clostridium sp. 001]QXE18855.1 hypothetical protein B5S50_08435 [Clostridium sp. 001]
MCIRKLKDNTNEVQVVGNLEQKYINMANSNVPSGEVRMNPGAIKHIKKKHPDDFKKYFQNIPEIIESPDYVGQNPKEKDSIELVKVIDGDVLVAVKLDPSGHLYFSSMYLLAPSKVPKRLKSGRLKKVNP